MSQLKVSLPIKSPFTGSCGVKNRQLSGFSKLDSRRYRSGVLRYHITSNWRVRGEKATVAEIFRDTDNIQNWWKATFLKTKVIREGKNGEIGKVVRIHAKGRAPFSMRFWFLVREEIQNDSFILEFVGDFDGFAVCSMNQVGEYTELKLEWNVQVRKPLLVAGSFLLKPLFRLNHLWAIAQGEKSLQVELSRRNGIGQESAPTPTFPHNLSEDSLFYSCLFSDPLENEIPDIFLRRIENQV